MSVSVTNCQFCGQSHGLRCPEVKAVEYNPDGTVKRVEYLTPADRYYPVTLPQSRVDPYPTSNSPRFISAFMQAPVQ